MKMASIFRTASNAMGEIVVDLWSRAFDAISASSKNLRLACAQHAASVIRLAFGSGLYGVLKPE
jgi:hypothetical protein